MSRDVPDAKRVLDVRGCFCPIPTVKASLSLEAMEEGETLTLLCDDPSTKRDLPAWAEGLGHKTRLENASDGQFIIHLTKGRKTP